MTRTVGTSGRGGARTGGGMLATMKRTMSGLSPHGKISLGVIAAAVVAVLALTVGLAVGRPNYPGEGSADVGFLRDMSSHHAQAVELGMIAFQKASREDIRELGRDIAMTQQAQIGRMQGWLAVWGVPTNTTDRPMAWLPDGESMLKGNLMPGMATREEIAQLRDATGEQVDILFLQYMLRHHLGGIHMVEGLTSLDPSPEVRALAQEMENAQRRENTAMLALLHELNASPLPN